MVRTPMLLEAPRAYATAPVSFWKSVACAAWAARIPELRSAPCRSRRSFVPSRDCAANVRNASLLSLLLVPPECACFLQTLRIVVALVVLSPAFGAGDAIGTHRSSAPSRDPPA